MSLRLLAAAAFVAIAAVCALVLASSVAQAQTSFAETLSVGGAHVCGVKSDGTIFCWGSNEGGQASPPQGHFTQVSVGYGHSCAIQRDGSVACWGRNPGGQTSPPDGRFTQVSAGEEHTCGIKSDGTVVCWGTAGIAFGSEWYSATPPDGRFTQVSTGGGHICGVKNDGALACWGLAYMDGQMSPPDGRFIQVSAGGEHSCGVRADGTVECWGKDWEGRTLPPNGRFTQVSVGAGHSCGLKSDGQVACWGSNVSGLLGSWLGQASPPDERFVQINAGGDSTCGVKSDGTVTCWGQFRSLTLPSSSRLLVPTRAESHQGVDGGTIELRIIARRLSDGRTEFGVRTADGEEILPRLRFFPANATVDRWLNSSPISVNGEEIGRINARLIADGRIEFAFTPTGGERISPRARYFPDSAMIDHWLRSSPIDIGGE